MRKTAKRNHRKKSYRKKSYRKKSYRKKIRRSPANKRRTIHKKRLVGGHADIFIGGRETGWLRLYEDFQYTCNIIVGGSGQQGAAGYRILFGSHELSWGGGGEPGARELGTGSYGVVKMARFRGEDWGVKQMKVPNLEAMSDEMVTKYNEEHAEIQKDCANELHMLHITSGAEGQSRVFPHPNLIKMTALIINTRFELPWIATELGRGQALDHNLFIEKWEPTTTAVLGMAMGIFRGLGALHRPREGSVNPDNDAPIIHRDIKSPNILLKLHPGPESDDWTVAQHEQNVTIIDLGLARPMALDEESKTMMMTGCGSVLWMAPEVLYGDLYNLKIDIFSAGMTILEMVSRRLPWAGTATNIEVPHRVTRGDRPRAQIPSGTPEPLIGLITLCWDKAPARRPDAAACCVLLQSMIDDGVGRVAGRAPGQAGGAGTALGYDPGDTPLGYDPQSPYIQSGNALPGFLHPKMVTFLENRDGKCQMCKGPNKKFSTTNCLGCGAALCESCLSQEAKGNRKNLKRWLCKESQALVTKVWSKEHPNKKSCFRIETPNKPKFKGLEKQREIKIVDETGTKKMVPIPSEGFDYGSFLITADEWEKIGVAIESSWFRAKEKDPPAKTLCSECWGRNPRHATNLWQMPYIAYLSPAEKAEEERKEELRESEKISPVMNSEEMPDESRPPEYGDKFYEDKILDIWQRHAIRDGPAADDRLEQMLRTSELSMKHLFVIVNLVYEILETADSQAPPIIADEMAAYLKAGGDGLSDAKIDEQMDQLIKAHGY